MRPLGVPRWVPHNTALRPPWRRALRAGPPLRSPPGSAPFSPPLPWRPSGGFLFWPPLAKSRPLQYDGGAPASVRLPLAPQGSLACAPSSRRPHPRCRVAPRSVRSPWLALSHLPPVGLLASASPRRGSTRPGSGDSPSRVRAWRRPWPNSCKISRAWAILLVGAVRAPLCRLASPLWRLLHRACTDLDSVLVVALVALLAAWRCPAAAGRTERSALGPWSPPAGPGRLPRAAGLVAPRPLPGRAVACCRCLCN